MTIYDIKYDFLDKEYKKVLKDVGYIALDLLGIVTAGIASKFFKDARFIAQVEGRMTGYENLLSLKFDYWNNISNKVGNIGVVNSLWYLGCKLRYIFTGENK